MGARIQIQSRTTYVRGLRLNFGGPDFREDSILPLWSDQFFDLLPGEQADCSVEFFQASKSP